MSAFTVITPTGDGNGRNWLEMSPAHFDASLLPARHRKPEPEGLFDVADVAAPRAKSTRPAAEMDGQADLFSEDE
jgi:hypothetical protein